MDLLRKIKREIQRWYEELEAWAERKRRLMLGDDD